MDIGGLEAAAGIHAELRQMNVHLGQISTNLGSLLSVLTALSTKLAKTPTLPSAGLS